MGAVNKKKIPTTKKSPKALKQNQEGGSVEGFLSVPVVKMASSQTTSYVDRKTTTGQRGDNAAPRVKHVPSLAEWLPDGGERQWQASDASEAGGDHSDRTVGPATCSANKQTRARRLGGNDKAGESRVQISKVPSSRRLREAPASKDGDGFPNMLYSGRMTNPGEWGGKKTDVYLICYDLKNK